jgi:NtrC-family two-component system response regulator AlgB
VADSVGKVEEAEGGTLFMDEIGDLGMDAQIRLLQFLNDRSYERLGETRERKADVRLIVATNRPLEAEVRAGRFREDLLFRLNVIGLTVPPLRQRPEDLAPMARHYLEFFGLRQGRPHLSFSAACESTVTAHAWPGNLRELRNAIERAVILAPAAVLEAADLGLAGEAPASGDRSQTLLGADVSLEELEREHIARVVARTPSFEAAARILNIDVTTLQRKRKRYGMS